MIYSYIITGPIRYAEYALISIFHLVYKGAVNPKTIYVTTTKRNITSNLLVFKLFYKLGINVRIYDGMYNKINILDDLFYATSAQYICQIDCDCVWMGKTDDLTNLILDYS